MTQPAPTKEVLRIGTWNILSYEDEYSIEYGCPLSISFCPKDNETTVTTQVPSINNCTRQRYQRIWNMLEQQEDQYDIICLQEVSDDFLAVQQPSVVTSNWTVVHRNQECVLLLSNASAFHIITTYHITSIPNLSGCDALPMVVLQQQSSSSSQLSYLVGSVHVQASVTNMSVWYQSTIDAILNTTYDEIITETTEKNTTVNTDWMEHPVMIIVGGDFNHNLTTSSTLSPFNTTTTASDILPHHWTLVAPSPKEIIVQGTTQKEYNYMGVYDGFLASTTSMMLQYPSSLINTTTRMSTSNITIWNSSVTDTLVHMNGFMPKVVSGFPQQENRTIQTTAQFALISKSSYSDTKTTFWNATMVENYFNSTGRNKTETLSNLHLIFSPSSNFMVPNAMIAILPYSHPIHDALSDHLFVAASFTFSATSLSLDSSSNSNASTGSNSTNNESSITKSSTFLSQFTPFGQACVYIGMILVGSFIVRLLWKCCCRRNSSFSTSSKLYQPEFDRVLTDTPPIE